MLFWELFQIFDSICKLFGAFLTNFGNVTGILCYFLCYFLKTPEFGKSPKIRGPATALIQGDFNSWVGEDLSQGGIPGNHRKVTR